MVKHLPAYVHMLEQLVWLGYEWGMSNEIQQAAEYLRSGRLVAFPTETVYGLGADATNSLAVQAIYRVKGRPSHNPLIVHVSDEGMAEECAEVNALAKKLIGAFWPGALTLVMKRRKDCLLADEIGAGGDTVALRCPAHPLAQSLIEVLGKGVAAPSANRSGRVSPTSTAHVVEELSDWLGNELAMILDDGECTLGIESTVVDVTGKQVAVLRPGNVTYDDIVNVLGQEKVQPVFYQNNDVSPLSPGLLTSHYAPNLPVRMNVAPEQIRQGEAYIGFGSMVCDVNLSPSGDMSEAARNLFAMLRQLDISPRYVGISVAKIPEEGLGVAINDRLRRAST